MLRVHYPGLARDIEETVRAETDTISAESGLPCHGPQSMLSRFSAELRAKYAEYNMPHHSNPQCRKWMPHVSKEYIHPDIISKEEQEEQPDSHKEAVLRGQQWSISEEGGKTYVKLAKLLAVKSGKKCKCVLVEGGPGMGKSTLAWQVCHCWGRREHFDQYSTVLLFPLRDKRVQQAKQVEDLMFFHLRDKEAQEEVKQGIGTGKVTLIILDGLDELPGHLLLEQSIFTDLLSGEVLGDATILVTSRPSAAQQLLTCWKQRISKHFVIHGFNNGDIREYAKSILSGEKLTEFQTHLSIHPHIQSIMYVPLHSAIVMAVYLRHKQLPKTLTQLYTWLVKIILSQYTTDHSDCNGEENVHFLGLKLPQKVHAYFMQLSKCAYVNVCDQQLIFSDLPEELHDLGFTDSVPELFLPKSCSYNFLHLSIQEFLAAYYVSHRSSQEQKQLLLRSRREHHFENMMRFVAGIMKFEGIRKETVKQVVVVEKISTKGKCCLDGYGLELLYECQNMSVLDKENTYTADLEWSSQAHHWLALGYCIANSKCVWEIRQSCHYGHTQMLVKGLQDCNIQPAYTIKYIVDHASHFIHLLTQAPVYFTTHMEEINMKDANFHECSCTDFCQWLPTCHLNTLSLPPLQPCDVEMVSRMLTAAPSLKILEMTFLKFTLQSMQAFVSMLQQNQSLTCVDIRDCSIDRDSACCLARMNHNNITVRILDMSGYSAGEKGILTLAEMLEHMTTLNPASYVHSVRMHIRIHRDLVTYVHA